MTKKLLSFVLAIVLSIAFFPVLTLKADAAVSGYDYKKALQFAAKNWNSGKGLCAEFVSDCLKAGGVTEVYNTSADGLYHDLVNSKLGKSYKLKMTSNGRTSYVMEDDNASVLKKGDPIFFYCNNCKRHTHVVISNGYNADGYSVDYAHNNAHNGKNKTCTYTHRECGRRNWTFYSIRMTNENVLFGKKTSLSAPIISGLKNVETGVQVKWNAVKNANIYRVYRKTEGTSWVKLADVKNTSFIDKKAVNGAEYTYTVKAFNGKTASQYYGGKSVLALSTPEFTDVFTNGKAIAIKWTAIDKAQGYYVYRRVNNGKWSLYAKLNDGKTTVFTDSNVKEDVTYSYRVLAHRNGTLSGYDYNGVKAEVIKAPKLKSLVNAIDGVKISWNVSKGAESYRVYRRSDDNKKWILLDETKGTSFIDETAVSGKAYKYTVRADSVYNRGGYDKKGVSNLFLDVPELEAASTDNGITLSWDKVKGAKGYYLYERNQETNKWSRISTLKNVDEYVTDEVEINEDYIYTIRAYSGKITSSYDKEGVSCTYGSHLTAETTETII